MTLHLNEAALARLAKSDQMKTAAFEAAGAIADNVRSQGITVGDIDGGSWEIALPVKISSREHITVSLAHPAGKAVQAKHGALTRAAAAAGLEVHG